MHKLIARKKIRLNDGVGECEFTSVELGNETFYSIVFESRHAPELIEKIKSSSDKKKLLSNMTIGIMKAFGVTEGVELMETNAAFIFDEVAVINSIMRVHDGDEWFNEIIRTAKIDQS